MAYLKSYNIKDLQIVKGILGHFENHSIKEIVSFINNEINTGVGAITTKEKKERRRRIKNGELSVRFPATIKCKSPGCKGDMRFQSIPNAPNDLDWAEDIMLDQDEPGTINIYTCDKCQYSFIPDPVTFDG